MAVPSTTSSSGAAARVTVCAVSQVAGANVREGPALTILVTGKSTLFWDAPARTVRSASPPARATAMVTAAMGWEVSRTV